MLPTVHLLLRLAAVVGALVDRGLRVDGIADGDHFFRQTLVLSNIDKALANGLLFAPASWNQDLFLRFYDFPIYQAAVALLVRATGGAPALLAEGLSALCAAVLLLVVWRISVLLRLGAVATTAALACLALAPLGRFWFAAAAIDPFTTTIATVSLLAWLELRSRSGGGRALALAVWLGAAFVATLIKSPIYAPIAAAIAWPTLREHGPRGLLRPPVLAWLGTMAIAIGLFLTVSAWANADAAGWPDRTSELAWYFGSTAERLSLEPHAKILERIVKQVWSVPVGVVAIGAVLAFRRWHTTPWARNVVLAWSLGAIGTSLLFLQVNVVHGYYQLPCLAPLALLAGVGVEGLVRWLGRTGGRAGRVLAAAAIAALVVTAAWSSERYLRRLEEPSTAALQAAGHFVRGHTSTADFVLFARPESDDNPAYLYFAQRDGANVYGDVSAGALTARWREAATARGGRLVLFVPADASAIGQGLPELAAGPTGRLLAVTPR